MAGETKIRSDVAGRVWEIPAPAGTRVAEGDPIIVLESMKMEIPVEAPGAGTVKEVLVAKEDAVAEDQPVAVLTLD